MKQNNNMESALQRMEDWMRLKHRDHKTRRAYVREVRRFAGWLAGRRELHALASEKKVEAYLTRRAREGCAASTQNVAFHALRCFYEHGLGRALQGVDALRAHREPTLRRAPSVEEVRAILPAVPNLYGYPCALIVEWLYASGLRVTEPLNARIKDLDFARSRFTVRDGKHGRDREVPIPCSLVARLREQMEIARLVWQQDAANQVPVPLPGRLAQKYPRAQFSWSWAWLFPAKAPCRFEGFRGPVRWRVHEACIQRAFKAAVRAVGASDDLSPHHLRHAYATHLMLGGAMVRDVQVAMWHRQLETTAGYLTPELGRLPAPPALVTLPLRAHAPEDHRVELSGPTLRARQQSRTSRPSSL